MFSPAEFSFHLAHQSNTLYPLLEGLGCCSGCATSIKPDSTVTPVMAFLLTAYPGQAKHECKLSGRFSHSSYSYPQKLSCIELLLFNF